jgi:hypothetical protein
MVTMPRAGSEYLQSLLDGHPEILVFILNFQFFSGFIKSADTTADNVVKINPSDFIYEFIGKEIARFKGVYHKTERLDRLGINGDDAFDIDLPCFINYFLSILGEEEASIKNIFLSLYGAYHLSVGRDIFKTKVILHHAHWYEEAKLFNDYFPHSKMICCIRDPRASIKSMVFNCKDNYYEQHHYSSYCGAMEIIEQISGEVYSKCQSDNVIQCIFVRLEDLPRRDVLEDVLNFIGVKPSSSVFVSTWAGLEWRGDRVSGKVFNPSEEWSINRSYNYWREALSSMDKMILESSFLNFLIDHDYIEKTKRDYRYWFKYMITFIFIMKPLTLEYDFYSISYAVKKIKNKGVVGLLHVLSTPYYYLRVRNILLRAKLKHNTCKLD